MREHLMHTLRPAGLSRGCVDFQDQAGEPLRRIRVGGVGQFLYKLVAGNADAQGSTAHLYRARRHLDRRRGMFATIRCIPVSRNAANCLG